MAAGRAWQCGPLHTPSLLPQAAEDPIFLMGGADAGVPHGPCHPVLGAQGQGRHVIGAVNRYKREEPAKSGACSSPHHCPGNAGKPQEAAQRHRRRPAISPDVVSKKLWRPYFSVQCFGIRRFSNECRRVYLASSGRLPVDEYRVAAADANLSTEAEVTALVPRQGIGDGRVTGSVQRHGNNTCIMCSEATAQPPEPS